MPHDEEINIIRGSSTDCRVLTEEGRVGGAHHPTLRAKKEHADVYVTIPVAVSSLIRFDTALSESNRST